MSTKVAPGHARRLRVAHNPRLTPAQRRQVAALCASTVAELVQVGHGLLGALGRAAVPVVKLVPPRDGCEVVHQPADVAAMKRNPI